MDLPHIAYKASDVSTRSLRSGGAMALLLAGVNKATIQLIGRWRSDAIFTYLHSSALPLSGQHAKQMFQHGKFTILTSGLTPTAAEAVIRDEFDHEFDTDDTD